MEDFEDFVGFIVRIIIFIILISVSVVIGQYSYDKLKSYQSNPPAVELKEKSTKPPNIRQRHNNGMQYKLNDGSLREDEEKQ